VDSDRRGPTSSPAIATARRSLPPGPLIAVLECRHRRHAHVEDRIRDDKDTGLRKFPFKEFALNEVWLEIVMVAHDLIVWTQALLLDGEFAKAEPKRLRYRNAARRRQARVLRTSRQAPPPGHLALGDRDLAVAISNYLDRHQRRPLMRGRRHVGEMGATMISRPLCGLRAFRCLLAASTPKSEESERARRSSN
jgi:Transposase DDE domain group 1